MLTIARLSAVLAAVAFAILPMGAGAQESPGGGELAGYTIAASALPAGIQFFDQATGIPVDPGEPHLEATTNYTSATLATGPQGRALASSIWPGPAIGDGFGTLCGCPEEWRVRAEAKQPGGEEQAAQEIPGLGAGMTARVKDALATAEADAGNSPNPEGLGFGDMSSHSTSKLEDNVSIATADSAIKDVSIGGGVITIESVESDLKATSDGTKGTATGGTTVDGLVIGGYGYTVDEDGLHPVQEGDEGDSPAAPPDPAPGEKELREQLGITVELAPAEKDVSKASASIRTDGLRITIETDVLRTALGGDELPADVILEPLPDQVEPYGYQFLSFSPRIDYVFGRARARAAATLPLPMPPLPDLPPPPAAPAGAAAGPTGMTSTDVGSQALGAADPPPVAGADAPLAAPAAEGAGPLAAPAEPVATQLPPLFGGLPPGLVAAGLLLAAVAARALAGVGGTIMGGGGFGGALCANGAVKSVPNLRES